MNATRSVTRLPGLLYWLLGVPGALSLQWVPATFYVPGNAAATAARITGAVTAYRYGVLFDLLCNVVYLILAWGLSDVFKSGDRKLARLLVLFVTVSVAIGFATELVQIAPLVVLSGASYLAAFTKPQLEALAMTFVRLRSAGLAIDSTFWGLWLLPFGLLVIKSGFLPRILGYCLIVGCVGYVGYSLTYFMLPAYLRAVSLAALPLYAIGEVPIGLWLTFKGVR